MMMDYDAALDMFASRYPDIMQHVDEVSRQTAAALGVSIDVSREVELESQFQRFAAKLGMSTVDFIMRLLSNSENELKQRQLAHHRRTAERLGLEWKDYERINQVSAERLGQHHFVGRS